MTLAQTTAPTPRRPLRLWPGVVLASLLVVVRYVVPAFVPGTMLVGVIGAGADALAILAWWVFFSRAPWLERLGAVALMIAGPVATKPLLHASIAEGAMGMLFYMLALPLLALALVAGAVAGRRLSDGPRRATAGALLVLACAGFTLVRTAGITGEGGSELHWRWSETPEERLLARVEEESLGLAGDAPAPLPSMPAATELASWPGFRGRDRDGVVQGVRIGTDWSGSPPVELWRAPVGPGWSSFAVDGDLFYTQEQRGDDELVACYRLSTGEPVWQHRDGVRFWESNGGAGPRATPTLAGGRVLALGATGLLNVLDAGSGELVWSRNVASDSGKEVPMWGFSSSPLIAGELVVAAAAGKLVAYDLATGEPSWSGPDHGSSYSSPHLVTPDGVPQIVLLSGSGASGVAPDTGAVLWEHAWPGEAIVQPASTADGDVLINSIAATGGLGLRRLTLAQGPEGWTVEERWTSRGLKPYYNDFVVHAGHAYGFDGTILSCIDLADGARRWKGGRYGAGQLVLLADQDLLLVLSEEGELALVAAAPEDFRELARFPAIQGKTWNHPALAGDVLLVRNGKEMAAFRLPLAGG